MTFSHSLPTHFRVVIVGDSAALIGDTHPTASIVEVTAQRSRIARAYPGSLIHAQQADGTWSVVSDDALTRITIRQALAVADGLMAKGLPIVEWTVNTHSMSAPEGVCLSARGSADALVEYADFFDSEQIEDKHRTSVTSTVAGVQVEVWTWANTAKAAA